MILLSQLIIEIKDHLFLVDEVFVDLLLLLIFLLLELLRQLSELLNLNFCLADLKKLQNLSKEVVLSTIHSQQ